MTVVYNRIALIGLGLIASSMFWSIRKGNLAQEVVGFAKSKKTLLSEGFFILHS